MGMNNQASIARKRWRGIIQRQVERGVSVSVFCREENVPQASFYHWRRKLREENGFAEVRVAPGSASTSSVAPGSASKDSTAPDRPSSSAKSSMDRLAPSARSPMTSSADSLELVLSNNRRIVVRPGFDHVTLVALIDTLDHVSTARTCSGLLA